MSNQPRTGITRSPLAHATLAALLGISLACSASSPTTPTLPTAPLAPVTPAPVVFSGVYTVTASTNTVAPGDPLSVSWTASAGAALDWIALIKVGVQNNDQGWWDYTGGKTSGTLTLSAPTQPGQYEFRYLPNDGYVDAARSSVVTVGADPTLNQKG
jgi:hypothetical protein